MNTNQPSYFIFICLLFFLGIASGVSQPADSTAVAGVTVTGLLLGNTPWELYTVAIIFSLMGAMVNTLMEVDKGVKCNKNSPDYFSRTYYWQRNARKVFLSVTFNLAIIRFLAFITPDSWKVEITNDWLLLISLVNAALGFGIDKFLSWVKPYVPWMNKKN